MNPARARTTRAIVSGLIFAGTLMMACTQEPSSPESQGVAVRYGKAAPTTDMSVTSATPDSATQDTTLDVVINGSGYVAGTVATWALAGVADSSQIRTNSTRYVSSRQLVANITIKAGATVAKWDIVVTASGKKGGIGTEAFAVKLRGGDSYNPLTTWKFPLNDAAFSLRSDRQYSDGTYSVYAAGTCNVTGTIFGAGPIVGSNDSGDATLQTSLPSNNKCGRVFTLAYPDGYKETVASFFNVRTLENSTYAIPIGTTAMRRFTINPGNVVNKITPRCSRLFLGEYGTTGVGSDSVVVTRIDASTWHVKSQPYPDDLGYCETSGQLYHFQVDFLIVSSFPVR